MSRTIFQVLAGTSVVFWSVTLQTRAWSEEAKTKLKEPDSPAARVGRYEHREFTIAVGEAFDSQRGGTIRLEQLSERSIVLKRKFTWSIPSKPAEFSIGNQEYLQVLAVDHERARVKFRLRTRVEFSVFDALRF